MRELVAFCANFGIEESVLTRADSHIRFEFAQTVKPAVRLGLSDFKTLTQVFGKSVNVTLANAPLEHIKIEHGVLPTNLAAALDYINQNPDLDFELRIRIDKAELLKRYIPSAHSLNVYMFLFEEALRQYLDDSVSVIDSRFFRQVAQKTVIVLPHLADAFMSPFLLVTGADVLDTQLRDFEQVEYNAEQQTEFRSLPETSVRWEGFALKHVTPTYFMAVKDSVVPWLSEAMNKLLLYTSLAFTANRTLLNHNELNCHFYGLEQTRSIKAHFKLEVLDLAGKSAVIAQLRELIEWLTDGNSADRLTIFQKVAARELAMINGITSLAQFIQQLPDVFEKTKWNYSLFIDGRIDKHFEEVKAASTYFASVAQSIAQKIDTMTKSMSEAFLGAIGVVLISFFASYINQNIGSLVFEVIVTAYGLFIVFVQMLYRMSAVWSEIWVLNCDLKEQVRSYQTLLTEKTVLDLTRQVVRRKNQFRVWFWLTILYYTIIVLALDVAAQLVPATISNR